MMSKQPLSKSILIGGAVAALQSAAAFAAGPGIPQSATETTIAAVSDNAQLSEMLEAHNDVAEESHHQVDQGMQEGANEAHNGANEAANDANQAQEEAIDAQSEAQDAQQEANEATQEGSEHNSQNNGEHSGDTGMTSG